MVDPRPDQTHGSRSVLMLPWKRLKAMERKTYILPNIKYFTNMSVYRMSLNNIRAFKSPPSKKRTITRDDYDK